MEQAIRIVVAAEGDQGREVLATLRPYYAVYAVADDSRLLDLLDQARGEGRPYDLVLLAHDPPLLGNAQTVQRLRVLAPNTGLIALLPRGTAPDGLLFAASDGTLTLPVDPEALLALVGDRVAERAAALARARAAVIQPLVGLSDALLRQPDLDRALRQLSHELDGLIPADYRYVALFDRARDRLVFPLYQDHGTIATHAGRPFVAGQGPAEWVLGHDTPLISGNFPLDAARRGWPARDPDSPFVPLSLLVLPLHLAGRPIGVFATGTTRPAAYGEAEVTLAGFVADLLAGVLAQWWTDLQWQRQGQILADFDRALTANGEPEAVLAATGATARQLTAMETATVVARQPTATGGVQYSIPPGLPGERYGDLLRDLTAQLAEAGQRGEPVDYTGVRSLLADLGARGVGRVVSHGLGGGAAGMLWLLHPTERPFDAHDRAALAAVSRQAGQALALADAQAARAGERERFARIAWRAAQETEPALLLGSALDEIRVLIPWQAAALWQADALPGGLRRRWHAGHPAAVAGTRLPPDDPLAIVAATRGGVEVFSAREAGGGEAPTRHGPALAVALRGYSAGQPAGLLVLERVPGAAGFTSDEAALLSRLGQVVGTGLEKLRWQGLAALHRRLATALAGPPAGVWDAVTAALATALGGGAVAVLIHDGGQWRPLAAALDNPAVPPPWSAPGQPLLRALTAGESAHYDGGTLAGHGLAGVAGLLLVPVAARGSLVGALAFWSSHAEATGEIERELLQHAAAHLAPALWTGQPGGGAVQDRRLLGLLQTVQQAAGTAADSGDLLQTVLLHALSNTPATVGAVLLREAGDRAVLRATYPAGGPALPDAAFALAETALRSAQPQIGALGAGSLAAFPLRDPAGGGAPRGVLVVGSPQPAAFSALDREMLAHLAATAAPLVGGQGLTDAERALRALTGLAVSRDQVLARVPGLVCQALGVPICLIHRLDRRTDRLTLAGATGIPPAQAAAAAPDLPGDSLLLERVFAESGPLAADLWPATRAGAGLQPGPVVAIWADGRPFGLISLPTPDGRPFSAAQGRALANLAAALGVALDGLQQARRLEALAALSAGLIEAGSGGYLPDPPTPDGRGAALLDRLVRSALELVEARAVYLLLRTAGPAGLVVQAAGGAVSLVAGADVPPPLAARLLALTGPQYIPDTRTAPDPLAFDPATRCRLVLPLPGEPDPAGPLGLLVVESQTPLALSEEDGRVLQAVAALAAGVVIQQGLVQQLQGQARQVQAMLDALLVAAPESDEGRVLAHIVASARDTLGADLVVLYPLGPDGALPDVPPQSGNRQAGALAGGPPLQALVRSLLATTPPAPLFIDDLALPAGAVRLEWGTAEGLESLALVPLTGGDGPLGVLLTGYRRRVRFDAAQRAALRLFGALATAALQRVYQGVRAAAALQGQMESLSLAAHELREPVDKVHMIIETALNGLWLPMSDTLRERLTVAYSLLDTHYEALGRVLQLGQLEAGRHPLAREATDVAALVQRVVGRHAEAARGAALALHIGVDPLLAPQRPLLDTALIGIALGNLVHNAIKFSPPGGAVWVRAGGRYVEGRRALVFTVEDQGDGIPPEARDQVFEPYYQVDHSLDRAGGGLGLGLALARRIVALHGGTLDVADRDGSGSLFTATLPFLTV